jgi:hypothetical protein
MSAAFAKPATTEQRGSAMVGLTVQAMLLVMGSVIALAPPSSGMILVAPMPGPFAPDIRWAWRAGAVPVARGPFVGSYVVRGSLWALFLPALAHGSLLVSARFTNCGNAATKDL